MAKKDAFVVEDLAPELEEQVEATVEATEAQVEATTPVQLDAFGNEVRTISPIIQMAIEQAAARKAKDDAHGFK